jgi:hypothetical protein
MGFYNDHIVPHLVNLAMRNRLLKAYRERTVSRAEGRVLEIGIGSGTRSLAIVRKINSQVAERLETRR